MKKFTLLMVAGLFALAGSVQAQEKKSLIADDITIKAGETAELVIKLDYETTETVSGTNFSISFPEGIVLDQFNSKEEQQACEKKKTFAKSCSIDEEDNPWGEDGDDSFFYDIKAKTDGGLLFILMDSDQTPFVTTHCKLFTIKLKALQDVEGVGKIYSIGFTNPQSKSLDLGNLADYEFGVNLASGINDIKAADATAPAYNLQGVRVNSAAKGVIIRDGKKMVVK